MLCHNIAMTYTYTSATPVVSGAAVLLQVHALLRLTATVQQPPSRVRRDARRSCDVVAGRRQPGDDTAA